MNHAARRGAPGRLPDDGALPDLRRALDPAHVARRFERRWPGPGRPPAVTTCALEKAVWSPGVRCDATYRLTLAPGDASWAGPTSSVGVVTVDPGGVTHRLFSDDEALPGLAFATRAELVGPWLAHCLGRAVDSCSISVVRYRPGARCVLRYTVTGAAGTVLFGKVMPGAAELASTMASLGQALVAPVVGVAPGQQVVVLADAGRRSLGPAATNPQLRAGGRLLARLHARPGPPGPVLTLTQDTEDLAAYLAPAEAVWPGGADLLAQGIDCLRTRAAELEAERSGASGPSHGAFRLDHVHLGPRGPVLIDLDSYGWAEPERDVGNLLAYLRWRAIRVPGEAAALARAGAAFLGGHAVGRKGTLDPTRVAAFQAASLLKIGGRRYRNLDVREWAQVPALMEAALELLEEGESLAPAAGAGGSR